MNNKLLPFYSLVLSTGLLFSVSNANAANAENGSFSIQVPLLSIDSGGGSSVYGVNTDTAVPERQKSDDSKAGIEISASYNLNKDRHIELSFLNFSTDNSSNVGTGAIYDNVFEIRFNEGTLVKNKQNVQAIDLDLVTKGFSSNGLDLGFSIGLKYANYYRKLTLTEGNAASHDNFTSTSKYKGFGPKFGATANQNIIGDFSIYGGASIAILSASSNFNASTRSNDNSTDEEAKVGGRIISQVTALDFGLKYSRDVFSTKLGYRLENWGNAHRSYPGAFGSGQNEDIGLSGAYLEGIVNF